MQNPNCDGSGPCAVGSQTVKVLPYSEDGNLILCFSCFCRELRYRRERNKELSKDAQFDLPNWADLEIYPKE